VASRTTHNTGIGVIEFNIPMRLEIGCALGSLQIGQWFRVTTATWILGYVLCARQGLKGWAFDQGLHLDSFDFGQQGIEAEKRVTICLMLFSRWGFVF